MAYVFPIKVAANGRTLCDQNGTPWPLLCDAGWGMLAYLNPTQQATYFSTRATQGFTAVMFCAPGGVYVAGYNNFQSYDGQVPFTTAGDISTPNANYWAEVDAAISLANSYGLVVLFNCTENGKTTALLAANPPQSMLGIYRNCGLTKCNNYGKFIGNRYKTANIIYYHFDDYSYINAGNQQQPGDDNLMVQIISGIQSNDTVHIHTSEMDDGFQVARINLASDDTTIYPYMQLNHEYTYFPSYADTLKAYNLASPKPAHVGETIYEEISAGLFDAGTPKNIRAQIWWCITAGGCGELYGNQNIFNSANNASTWPWQNHLNTTGAIQFGYLNAFLTAIDWINLIPDQSSTFITAGRGTYLDYNSSTLTAAANCAGTMSNNYVTGGLTADKKLGLIFCPQASTITVDLTKMLASITARWYDPTNNTFQSITGSPFLNTSTHNFTTPGNNSGGDPDWVLLLQAAPNQFGTDAIGAGRTLTNTGRVARGAIAKLG